MNKQFKYLILSLFAGGLLAVMAHLNFQLSLKSSSYFSSLWVHLIGFASALILIPLLKLSLARKQIKEIPWWAFFSGMIGAMSVVTINYAIDGPIGLSGALALSLAGQIICGRGVDSLGLWGMKKRQISWIDLMQILLVLSGSLIIIFFAKGN